MSELERLRKRINGIDASIVRLINARLSLARRIGIIKSRTQDDVYAPSRERAVIENVLNANAGPISDQELADIYSGIIHACRAQQRLLSIAYFGPEGTYTHGAALKVFGARNRLVPYGTIGDVFRAVEGRQAEYGVVPVENTTEGIVTHTLDMFLECDLYICSELNMRIEHRLLSRARSLAAVRTVYSHPQPLAQCRQYLRTHLPGAHIVETASTAEAARLAAAERGAAAIASAVAARIHGLHCLAENIEDHERNFTRFLVIGTRMAERSGTDKTSILFMVKDRIGILHDALSSFKKYRINLTKIESRPSKTRPWEYVFYTDLLGHIADKRVRMAIEVLKDHCVFYKFLGSYPSAR